MQIKLSYTETETHKINCPKMKARESTESKNSARLSCHIGDLVSIMITSLTACSAESRVCCYFCCQSFDDSLISDICVINPGNLNKRDKNLFKPRAVFEN
jgi:hypothetical protein